MTPTEIEIPFVAVVVAQLVEQLPSSPEIRSSNPDMDNFIYYQLYLKDEN